METCIETYINNEKTLCKSIYDLMSQCLTFGVYKEDIVQIVETCKRIPDYMTNQYFYDLVSNLEYRTNQSVFDYVYVLDDMEKIKKYITCI